MVRLNHLWFCLTGCLIACVGCSSQPRTYPAGGVVKFKDGQPLKGGRIELRSVSQPYSARGAVDGEGRFKLTTFKANDGAIAGKHQVVVTPALVLHMDNPSEHASHAQKIDSQLSRYATTWLELTIDPKGDNQNFIIEVE